MTETALKVWYAADVTASAASSAAIENAFDVLEAQGTEVDSLRKKPGEDVVVTGFFDRLPELENIENVIQESLASYGLSRDSVRKIDTREVVEEDWLAEWKRHWRPTDIGAFVIAPPWSEVDETDKIVIRIEPNMAFGTGTHDTTKLCLRAIGEQYSPEMSVLDVGTGTGILAIAAAKLGGSSIFACDTDADSIRIARENAVLNGVGDRIEFADGPIGDETSIFDFTFANLTVDVILPILPLLIDKTKKLLLLSGILAEQADIVNGALSNLNAFDYRIERSGEWVSFLIDLS